MRGYICNGRKGRKRDLEISERKKVVKICVWATCLYAVLAGSMLYLDMLQMEEIGMLDSSDLLDMMVNKYFILSYFIVVPIAIAIATVFNSRLILALSVIFEEFALLGEYKYIRKYKEYGRSKPVFLVVSVLVIIFMLIWMIKKLNIFIALGVMLLSQAESVYWLLKKGMKLEWAVFMFTIIVAGLMIHTLPLFVVKDK